MFVKSALRAVFVAAMLAAPLPGCGGGGGGAPAPEPPPEPPPMQVEPSMGIPDAARNPPAGDAVTVVQSSTDDTGAAAGIAARVEWRAGGDVDYSLSQGEDWSVDSGDGDTRTLVNQRGISAASGLTVTAVLAFKGRSRDTGTSAGVLSDGIGVAFHTDIEGADDDYLVWGSWTEVPGEEEDTQDIDQGVFATGSDPFRPEAPAQTSGTARYRGDVRGMYFAAGRTPAGGYSFGARVSLLADFGDGATPGTIGGSIGDFLFQVSAVGSWAAAPGVAVTLGAAPLDGADGGPFAGATTGTFDDGTPLSGQWGGRFYGNAEADGAPGAVAGTFGAAGAEGAGLLGAFGAPRQ